MSTRTYSATGPLMATACFVGGAVAQFFLARYLQSQRSSSSSKNTTEETSSFPAPRRYGAAIQLKREGYTRYRELHDNVWEHVLERMYQSNIRNFVIYYHEETSTMYQSYEWVGHWKAKDRVLSSDDENTMYRNDMQAIADDPITRKWWMECEPCQDPFNWTGAPPSMGGSGGDWWAPLECVCYAGNWPLLYSEHRSDPDFVKMT